MQQDNKNRSIGNVLGGEARRDRYHEVSNLSISAETQLYKLDSNRSRKEWGSILKNREEMAFLRLKGGDAIVEAGSESADQELLSFWRLNSLILL